MNKRLFILLLLVFFLISTPYADDLKWYKGNLHSHTTRSDGNQDPMTVAKWYKEHNYDFLSITDHNTLTIIDISSIDPEKKFLLIPGEEVTASYKKKKIHINAFDIKHTILPLKGSSVRNTLEINIKEIIKSDGIAQIDHPNYYWSYAENDIYGLNGVKLIEIYNYNKKSNNFPAGGSVSTEMLWDKLLSRNMLIYGTASDDSHNYKLEFLPEYTNPGKAWIMVRAKDLRVQDILSSLMKGDFYCSNGIIINDIKADKKEYSLSIKQQNDEKYSTFFIGKNGNILKEVYGNEPVYKFKGDELYVRAKVASTTGDFALTQPYFLK